MRVNHLAKRTAAILLLLCMIIMTLSPITASALDTQHIGIAINETHEADLIKTFATTEGAADYAGKQHGVELLVGSTQQLSIVGASEADPYVTWRSSDDTIVTVSENGELVAVKEGSAIVTVEYGNTTASINVEVLKSFALNYSEARLSINKLCNMDLAKKGDLTEYVYYADWVTTNESLALVGKGLVLASRTGTGEIIAYIYEHGTDKPVGAAHCSIEVLPDITSVAISNKATRLELGSTMQLNVKTLPERQQVIWESSNPKIAIVDENGLLTATGIGTVTISAYAGVWSDNVYSKVESIVSQVTIEIWSDATTKYNIAVKNGARGEIIANKTTALAGETITVTATPSYDKTGNQIEAFGATALSVVDENGMAVTVTTLKPGLFTFEMPKSPVQVSAVYSSLYGVTCETALKANFARNNNLVGKIVVNEYVGGSFSGNINFASSNVVLSTVEVSHGETVKNADGTITVVIDNAREIATDIVLAVYADAQNVSSGSHSISVFGDLQMVIDNSFVACTTGNIATNAVIVDKASVQELIIGSTLTLTGKSQIVIYGEALKHIMENYISLDLIFDDGSISIPHSSLSKVDVEQGDFTIFSMTRDEDVFGNEKTLGKYALSARTYTNTGASKNQMNMIGKVTLKLNGATDTLLTLQTGAQTVDATKSGVFEMPSMAGLETFTVLIGEAGMTVGDVLSTILIIVLIIALIVAVFFLLRRMQIIKHAPTKQPESELTEKNPDELVDNLDTDTFNEQAFKTVDEILKESNLAEEMEMIRGEALSEMKAEVEREISEATIATEHLKKYDSIPELKEHAQISENNSTYNDLESQYLVLSDAINAAEDSRKNAMDLLTSDCTPTTDEIHCATDKVRSATSEMISARESFAADVDAALTVLSDLSQRDDQMNEAKDKLRNAIETAQNNMEKPIGKTREDFAKVQSLISKVRKNGIEIGAEDSLILSSAETHINDFNDLCTRLPAAVALGESMLIDADIDYSATEMNEQALTLLSILEDCLTMAADKFSYVANAETSALALIEQWSEQMRLSAEADYEKTRANFMALIESIKDKINTYAEIKHQIPPVVLTLSDESMANANARFNEMKQMEEKPMQAIQDMNVATVDPTKENVDILNEVERNLDDLIDAAKILLDSCRECNAREERDALIAELVGVIEGTDTEMSFWKIALDKCVIDPEDHASAAKLNDAQNALNVLESDVKSALDMIKDRNRVHRENVDASKTSIKNGTKKIRQAIEDLEASIAAFAKEKGEAERIAAENAAREQAEMARKAEAARIEIERQAKMKELARKRRATIDAEDPISVEHTLLVERFEDCIKKVADVYAENMTYLNSLKQKDKTDDHDYLDSCTSILYHNANEVFASNYWEMPSTMLSQLVTALEQDIEIVTCAKDLVDRTEKPTSTTAFRAQRLPRKKIRYWQNQMESNNPYVALIAMSKVEAHKLRVKNGVIAHHLNSMKQK